MKSLFQPGKLVALRVQDHHRDYALFHVLELLGEISGEDFVRIVDLGDRLNGMNPLVYRYKQVLRPNFFIWKGSLHKDSLEGLLQAIYESGDKYVVFNEIQWMVDNGGPLSGRPQDCQDVLKVLREGIPPDVSVLFLIPQRSRFYTEGDGVSGWTTFADKVLVYSEEEA